MSDIKDYAITHFEGVINETLKQNELPHNAVRLAIGACISILLISLVLTDNQFTDHILGANFFLWLLMLFVFYFVGLVIDLISISAFSKRLGVTAKDHRFFYNNREGNRYLLMKSIFIASIVYVASMAFYIFLAPALELATESSFIEYYGLFLSSMLAIASYSYGVSKRQSTRDALAFFREHEGRDSEEQLKTMAESLAKRLREENASLKKDLSDETEKLNEAKKRISDLKAFKSNEEELLKAINKGKKDEIKLNERIFDLESQVAHLERTLKENESEISKLKDAEKSIEETITKRVSESLKEAEHEIKIGTLEAEIETKKEIIRFFDQEFFGRRHNGS